MGAHAKKHPVSFQGTLGFLGFGCFPKEHVTFSYQKSMDFRAPSEERTGAATVGTHAKKHPASLQGTLGFLGFGYFITENVTLPCQKTIGILWFQGWVSCERFLVAELLL